MKNGKNGRPEPIVNIGDIYGLLTIIEDLGIINHIRFVIAKCECGDIKQYRFYNISNKNTQSCGCLNAKLTGERSFKHGLSKSRIYHVWSNMKERCYSIENKVYESYGGRGIKVCDEWKNDSTAFFKWSYDNGYKEVGNRGCQLDRIDNDGNYEPSNCRWVTYKVQANNKRNTLYFEYNGERKCFTEWCSIFDLNYNLSRQRMKRNHVSFESLIERFSGELKKNK